jgi:predicted nucleic acid-binding protein
VLIEQGRGRLGLESYLAGRGSEAFYLSVITVSELLHGVHGALDLRVKARRSAWFESMLERMPILPIDTSTARAHSQVWSHPAEAGRMIGPMIDGSPRVASPTDSLWRRQTRASSSEDRDRGSSSGPPVRERGA